MSSIITDFDKDDITLSFSKTKNGGDVIYNNISQYETLLKNSKLNQISIENTNDGDYTNQSGNVLLYLSKSGIKTDSLTLDVSFNQDIYFNKDVTYIFEVNISDLSLNLIVCRLFH